MASPAAAAAAEGEGAVTGAMVSAGFAELERQQQLLATCTRLYQQLTDHFGSLERGLAARSDALRVRRRTFDARTHRALDSLHRREASIDGSVSRALDHLDSLSAAAASGGGKGVPSDADADADAAGLAESLRALCTRMDSAAFLGFVAARRKEADALRAEMPSALKHCVDPAKFVMDAVADVFPVDRREVKNPADLAWACVLIFESAVPALADPDPEIGAARPLVPRAMKERARGMARGWKEAVERKGGVEGAKPPDAHAFLQHVATFAVAEREDRPLYRRIIVSFSWRRQMPRLAVTLGLEEEMADIIEELIAKRQQLDAVNFTYEAGLQEKFPPVPLLKSYLEDSKKTPSIASDNSSTSSGQSGSNVNKKEQSALRAVIKCVEDRKLEAEFPPEDLRKQLEELEKAKTEKKKAASSASSGGSSGPANKRIRASNGGPMPPAKAGRLTNNTCVSSFPAPTTFAGSPSHMSYATTSPSHMSYATTSPSHTSSATASPSHTSYTVSPSHASYAMASPYTYDRPAGHALYCNRSPPVMREPYVYPAEVSNVGIAMPYTSPPLSYPAPYGRYGNGMGTYNNGMAPAFHQAYYR
ncbi:FRIGIDA-like protein 4a isoform X2 [Phragmites australis]|uniref:FRIGIDA-like protein 4a isoform X2 n=1 Tax=Phragmites australis TaxID=29695 RepID=UPI002D788EF1|nr:FRIGIDA-like protein 4a isoform X2 [Phragmites australis]